MTASLEHINTFVHPQVILIDESSREDPFFTKAMRSKAMDAGKSLIELPIDAVEHMMWLTRLDSASLAGASTPIAARPKANHPSSLDKNPCRSTHSSPSSLIRLSYPALEIVRECRLFRDATSAFDYRASNRN